MTRDAAGAPRGAEGTGGGGTTRTVRGRRRSLAGRVAAAVVLLLAAAVAVAPLVGWERTPGLAALLPARSALTVAAAAALVVVAATTTLRAARPTALPLVAALAVAVVAHGAVLLARGVHDDPVAAPVAGQLRVLEWNTNGPLVSAAAVARLAAQQDADVVVLPQTNVVPRTPLEVEVTLDLSEQAFTDAGHPMTAVAADLPDVQVVVALSPQLAGHYTAEAGPDPVKTVVLRPDDASLPTILALHAPWPVGGRLAGWRTDLDWVERECTTASEDAKVLVVGDFNASDDDFGGPALGRCDDAASLRRAAAVGTWPTRLPPVLGMPIDHVLLTPAVGHVASFTVLSSEDGSGARHRPTMTVIETGG